CPLWIIAVATAFAVIFAKEVFGGTGMNILNVALVTRAFLFFSYPSTMSGDKVWVNGNYMDCINGVSGTATDAVTAATSLGQLATGDPIGYSFCDTVTGFIPCSIGETSVIAIAIGAFILLWSGVASWKTMLSVFVGGILTAFLFKGSIESANFSWFEHITVGGFCFGAVFMATDPVTSARTECGKWIYGFLIGVIAIIIRVLNPGYPEGMMLAILLMNVFAPLIDYYVVKSNINMRAKRATK
ncbi:MAG: RnfABCDGE type electron transport complex subunit D, partial [Bacteroidaceae bacterium]|nr:RnfABCDGE type electron transport complex subunit D [Bacteroidaceae bacterium]